VVSVDSIGDERRFPVERVAIYGVLTLFAGFYLVPLMVVVLNSVRTLEEISRTSMIGWPEGFAIENFTKAWSQYCIAEACVGIQPYMINSIVMVVPATIISTMLGAINGYSLSLWRFRGDNLVFAVVTLGVFLPDQMKLVPWALVLRDLNLSNTVTGLILIHVIQGICFTTLFCRNYYANVPVELIKAAKIDGAGYFRIFWSIILPISPPILIVTVIWQFTGIWNEFLFGVTFSEGAHQPVTAALIALSETAGASAEYGIQSAAVLLAAIPTLLVYFFGGKYFVRGLTAGAVK
jgi:glucose/mannose transport system permease protein